MSQILNNHVINLSVEGRLRQTGELYTPPWKIDQLFDALEASKRNSITIFFHGGVNSEQKGVQIAEKLHLYIENQFDSYPIFFVWESGVLETIRSELQDIGSHPLWGKIRSKLLQHVERYLERRRAGDDVRMVPESMLTEPESAENTLSYEPTPMEVAALEDALLNDAEAMAELTAVINNHTKSRGQLNEMQPESLEMGPMPTYDTAFFSAELLSELERNDHEARNEMQPESIAEIGVAIPSVWAFVGRTFIAIARRYLAKNDHGLHATVMEEIYRNIYVNKMGSFLWSGMKSKASSAYRENPDTSPTDDFFGGSFFVSRLADYARKHPTLEINLIGHSAGSIHICHFVALASELLPPHVKIHSISFLTPAATIELVAEKLVPQIDRVNHFRIFAMDDERERKDVLIKGPGMNLIYPHSLLYLVSGLFEPSEIDKPLIGLERHLKGARYANRPDVRTVRQMLDSYSNAAVVYAPSTTGDVGKQADFHGHGASIGPNEDPRTLQSLAFLISGQIVPLDAFRS